MPDIARRNFLFGTVATAATAAGLVLRAPDDALQLFKPSLRETLAVTRLPELLPQGVRFDPVGIGDTLYNKRRQAVAVVTGIQCGDALVDVSTFASPERSYVAGFPDITLEARAIFTAFTEHRG